MRLRRVVMWLAVGILLLGTGAGAARTLARCTGSGPVLCTATVGRGPIGVGVDSRAGHAFVVNRDGGTVSMLDVASGKVVRTTDVGRYALGPVVAPLAGRVFVYKDSASMPGTPVTVLTMLDAASGDVLRRVNIGVQPTALAVADRAGLLLVGTMKSGLRVLDARSGRALRRVPLWGAAERIAVDERLGRAYVSMDGITKNGLIPIVPGASAVATIDLRTGRVVRTVAVGHGAYSMAVDEGTGRLFVLNADDGTVSVLDARSGAVARTVRLTLPVQNGVGGGGAAIDTRAGRVVVVTAHDATARLLDARTGAIVATVRLGTNPGREWWGTVAVDEGSGRAFAVGQPGTRVLDTRSGRILRTIDARGVALAVDSGAGHVFETSYNDLSSVGGIVETIREIVSKDGSNVHGSVSTLDGRG